MRISVFGIGYVGTVTSACLADTGYEVVAVDPKETKIQCIQEGKSPVIEPGLDDLIASGIKEGRLRATSDYRDAVMNSEMSLICVGTPSASDGRLDLTSIEDAARQIASVLRDKKNYHVVVVRSTVVPGTLERVVKPILERVSSKTAGKDFGLGNNPEFLRENRAIEDYYNPTQIVVGAFDNHTAEKILALYNGVIGPRTVASPSVAEAVKYVSNAWRVNKVAFANEVGNILKRHGIDSCKVMEIFLQDRKINMGPSFMMPGFSFGGSCLTKDVGAIRVSANDKGLPTPVFDSLMRANELQILNAFELIRETGRRKVGLLGVGFRSNTRDLRESPLLALAEILLQKGYQLRIFDPDLSCDMKNGRVSATAATAYDRKNISHILNTLTEDPGRVISEADVMVIGKDSDEIADLIDLIDEDIPIVDLVRLNRPIRERKAYAGICW